LSDRVLLPFVGSSLLFLFKFPSSVAIATAFLISIDSLLLLMSILLLLLFLRYVLRDCLFGSAIHNFVSTDKMNLALEIVFDGHCRLSPGFILSYPLCISVGRS
jgi:hypothetical protein